MSRIGKMPISVPAGVEVKNENNLITVKGPKGQLSRQFSTELGISVEDGTLTVTRPSDDKRHRALHGLTRTLINNMVEGVTNGYFQLQATILEIYGLYCINDDFIDGQLYWLNKWQDAISSFSEDL